MTAVGGIVKLRREKLDRSGISGIAKVVNCNWGDEQLSSRRQKGREAKEKIGIEKYALLFLFRLLLLLSVFHPGSNGTVSSNELQRGKELIRMEERRKVERGKWNG